VVAGASLAAAGLGRLAIGVAATRTALLSLGVSATGVRTALAGLSGAGLLAVAGFVAAAAASTALGDQLEKNSAGIEGYKTALVEASDASLNGDLAKFGDSFALLGQGVDDTSSAFAALADTQNVVSQGFRKFGDFIGFTSTAGALAGEFDKIDQALVQMDPDKAAAAFSRLSDQARAAGLSTEQINSTFDDYKKKQEEAASASGAAASALRSSEIAFKNSAAAVQGGAGAFRDYGPAVDASLAALSAIDPAIKRTADQSAKLAGSHCSRRATPSRTRCLLRRRTRSRSTLRTLCSTRTACTSTSRRRR
jgi:hypothetical protein